MSHVLGQMQRKVDNGEVDPEDLEECAEAVIELREEYPEAWSICSLANDNVLEKVAGDS